MAEHKSKLILDVSFVASEMPKYNLIRYKEGFHDNLVSNTFLMNSLIHCTFELVQESAVYGIASAV